MMQLSALQFPTLRHFVEGKPYLSIEEAQALDQRPFRSMLKRAYVAYRPGRGFHITPEGLQAWDDFRFHNYLRTDPTRPLTAYFDQRAYSLAAPKVHIIKKRRAA
jgi:hypothetical protein